MMDQKDVEKLYIDMNKIQGECNYYRQLTGRYRTALRQATSSKNKWRTLFIVTLSLLLITAAGIVYYAAKM